MNKENLNLAPGSGAEDTKSDKAAKAKKVAGKAAQFAAAAGAGVAGTMAAEAMNAPEPADEVAEGAAAVHGAAVAEEAEPIVEEVVEFDPNDIMIEDVEEIVIELDQDAEVLDGEIEMEPLVDYEPVTSENIMVDDADMAVIDVDDIEIDVDDFAPDTDEEWDMSGEYIADAGDMDLSEPDILNDILA